MNFDRPGWFDRYTEFREQHAFPAALPTSGVRLFEQAGVHHEQDEAAYAFLQPTGLLYGFPVAEPFPPEGALRDAYADKSGRVLQIWLESLFACLVADRNYLLSGVHDEADPFRHAMRTVSYFFLGDSETQPRGVGGALERGRAFLERLPVGRNRPLHGPLERELTRRVSAGGELLKVPQYAYNGFLFLDLYYCMAWQRAMLQEPGKRLQFLGELLSQQRQVREALLQLLIAAAHASGDVDDVERRVFARFLASARLPKEPRERLRGLMRAGLRLDQIVIPEAPWLVRRHLLDLTLMMVLADRTFDQAEQAFAAELVRRLGLWEEELEQTQAALGVFLVNNEQELRFLKGRTQMQLLAERVTERAQTAVRKNIDRIANEVRETRELYDLLMKSRSQTLTPEERRKVRDQLGDILKTIPTLALFAMPGGSVILPILIRLLPFNLLPTSFED